MLRFRYRGYSRKLRIVPGGGPQERIRRLRKLVSGLIRYERIEPVWTQGDEARQYAERLLYLAIKNGDTHKQTMDTANYWLVEKDLVHKLFKVLVPRYKHYKTCYTDLHKLAVRYPGSGMVKGVLELKGNPWPPIIPRQRDTKYLLSNVLLSAARQDFYQEKDQQRRQRLEQQQDKTQNTDLHSSSVDPPSKPSEVD